MKKTLLSISAVVVLLLLIWAGTFFYKNLRGIGPAIKNPPIDIANMGSTNGGANGGTSTSSSSGSGLPLKLPSEFAIEIFAKDLPGARVMKLDQVGNMWVSQTSKGTVSMLQISEGKVVGQNVVLKNLKKPHGLAFDPTDPNILYIAEEDKIVKTNLATDGPLNLEKIADLPSGGGHFTRTIAFGPDDRLYVSIGSSCNVCDETNDRRAKIFSLRKDGSDFKEFARGLRNAVFFAWNYVDGKMWATENSRDLLGDDIPPDEINIVENGKNYGWPICYGKNIHDDNFDKKTYIRNPCTTPFETPSHIDIPAHSAALGLAFIPEEGWPNGYGNDLLVAYHGSWNRSTPTGYKVVRMKLDNSGNHQSTEDFITGWLTGSNSAASALGRPVDIMAVSGGTAYISDDKAGVIYRVFLKKEAR